MDMNIVVKLGKRLKMIRIAAGIKQKELSRELKIPASLLSMYESGSREPSLNFLENFANHFNFPISQLFVLMDKDYIDSDRDKAAYVLNELKSYILRLERESLKSKFDVK